MHSNSGIENRSEASPVSYAPLRQLILTDEVSRVLFTEYTAHRQSHRGDEETGWVLLGIRRADEALALATIPAGADRDAGDSHVKFNSVAQAFAAQVVRQENKYLTMLGVIHTHPGSLRHPSDGDYRGDIQWVPSRRGGEGIFGIGTADVKPRDGSVAWQPTPNVQCLGEFCFSWYSLREGDRNYRQLPVQLTLGPDLALPLRSVWEELETHAERLDRLARQLRQVSFDVMPGKEKPALVLTMPLPESDKAIRVFMEGKEVRYLLIDSNSGMIADLRDDRVDRAVFLLLSELSH